MLPVNEVFATIQGEGWWQGVPAVFVRLQGCDVGCPWCDTKHTWDLGADAQLPADQLLNGPRNGARTWARLEPKEIAARVLLLAGHGIEHVVVTGGEPAMHPLHRLCDELEGGGFRVQIETSGTHALEASPRAWVTLSPKLDMPGGREVLPSLVNRADEIKHPVGKLEDVERLRRLLDRRRQPLDLTRISLQPLSQSPKATAVAIEAAMRFGYRVSAQLHKFLDLP